jgi:hypothetical protein
MFILVTMIFGLIWIYCGYFMIFMTFINFIRFIKFVIFLKVMKFIKIHWNLLKLQKVNFFETSTF